MRRPVESAPPHVGTGLRRLAAPGVKQRRRQIQPDHARPGLRRPDRRAAAAAGDVAYVLARKHTDALHDPHAQLPNLVSGDGGVDLHPPTVRPPRAWHRAIARCFSTGSNRGPRAVQILLAAYREALRRTRNRGDNPNDVIRELDREASRLEIEDRRAQLSLNS